MEEDLPLIHRPGPPVETCRRGENKTGMIVRQLETETSTCNRSDFDSMSQALLCLLSHGRRTLLADRERRELSHQRRGHISCVSHRHYSSPARPSITVSIFRNESISSVPLPAFCFLIVFLQRAVRSCALSASDRSPPCPPGMWMYDGLMGAPACVCACPPAQPYKITSSTDAAT